MGADTPQRVLGEILLVPDRFPDGRSAWDPLGTRRQPDPTALRHSAATSFPTLETGGDLVGLRSASSGISPPTAAVSLQALPGHGAGLPAARGWLRRLGEPLGLQPPEQEAVLRVLDAGLERCLALHAACIPLPGHRYGRTGAGMGMGMGTGTGAETGRGGRL